MPEPQDSVNNAPAPPPPLAPLLPLAGIVEDLAADAAARRLAKSEGRPLGPVTGFSKLDVMLSGSLMPGLHILHGSPGVGKSAFALGLACAGRCGSWCGGWQLGDAEVGGLEQADRFIDQLIHRGRRHQPERQLAYQRQSKAVPH